MRGGRKKGLVEVWEALLAKALALPEAYEANPWGERVAKVREKIFFFSGGSEERFGISVKLPESRDAALALPFTEPTGYGLGKSGWVSARFTAPEEVPVPLIEDWILESYRAVAPKRLAAGISAPMPAPAARPKARAKAKAGGKRT